MSGGVGGLSTPSGTKLSVESSSVSVMSLMRYNWRMLLFGRLPKIIRLRWASYSSELMIISSA